MPLAKGDFILVDFVAKVKDTGEIFDLTIEEVAKKENIHRDNVVYEPMLVVLGEGWMLKSLEEKLYELNPGDEKSIELKPEEAFGVRDPSKVKIISAREVSRRGVTPRPGVRVELDDGVALIRSVGSGRVVLDFNHPLAGKTLVYDIHIVKKLEILKEKILALIHRRIPKVDVNKFVITIRKNSITIEVPEEARFVEGLQFAKRGVIRDIERLFKDIAWVKFTETYKFEREKPKAKSKAAAKKKAKKESAEQ